MGKTLREYRTMVKGKICRSCGTILFPEVDNYDHEDGWEVEGYEEKQWLSAQCRGCGYHNALDKLGISRPQGKLIRK